jgi:hypothetical protein
MPRRYKMIWYGLSTPCNIASSTATCEFSSPFAYLNHRFIDFSKVVSYDVQKAGYDFSGQFAHLKHHFLDFVHFAFFRFAECRKRFSKAYRHLETSLRRLHQSRFLRPPEGRLLVIRAIRLFETKLPRLRTSPFFWIQIRRKWVRSAFRHIVTSLHRHPQTRILRPPEGRYCASRALRLLKIALPWFGPSRLFGCPECRKWIRISFRHL